MTARAPSGARELVHIRCGDDLRTLLPDAGLPGGYLRWCDPVCDGPTPPLEGEAWYALRARFITERYGEILATVYGGLVEQDAALARAATADETVLWFEHDLFDQAILIRLLAWFADHPARRLSLVQADDHLGAFKPRELSVAYSRRRRVTADDLAYGKRAWEAWRAPTPDALMALMSETSPLPHAPAAIRRHLEEFPDRSDGLSRTERLTLLAVADGARGSADVFRWVSRAEEASWLGDTMFWPTLDDLAHARMPLIRLQDGGWHLTPAGEMALLGKLDATQFNWLDRWRGGVHLSGRSDWRWDPASGRVVSL